MLHRNCRLLTAVLYYMVNIYSRVAFTQPIVV